MDYRDYLDWTEMSGIYVRQYSHGDRYRTFKKQISQAGLNTLVVAEFLNDNPGETLDVPRWRTFSVYEAAGDRGERIELTVAALAAIGAPRAAAAVRNARSNSPFEALLHESDPDAFVGEIKNMNPLDMLGHLRESAARLMPDMAEKLGALPRSGVTPSPLETESWQEIERLLERYVAEHQAALEDDLAKHGDPRILPGYTRQGRLKELEKERLKLIYRESQRENIPKLRGMMNQLEKRFGGGQEVPDRMRSKMHSTRQRFLDQLKENRKMAAEAPLPEMLTLLQEAEAFIQANPAIFEKKPLGDTKLQKRLAALGDYERREGRDWVRLIWDKPTGFDVGWNHFKLTLAFPAGARLKVLSALLDVAERTQARMPALSEQWRRQLIEHFREREGWMEDWELEEAERDDNGQVTETSILGLAGAGEIALTCLDERGEEFRTDAYFSIEWDQEHGLEINWEDESPPEERSSTDTERGISLGKVQLLELGPSIDEAALGRFERKFDIELPSAYRSFLLQSNGGIPDPNHLPLRSQGELFPYDVEFFLSLAPEGGEPSTPPERSLESVLQNLRQQSLTKLLLPIAQLKPYVISPISRGDYLFLVLSGKKAGRLVLFENDPIMELGGHRVLDEKTRAKVIEENINHAFTAAKSLEELLRKLKRPPRIEVPDWLRMIQKDDRNGFLAWLDAGGSMKAMYQGYGEFGPTSIIDYLARDASPELLSELMNRDLIKPKQIRRSWQDRYRYDVDRFRRLMPLLPKDLWAFVLASPRVWDQMDLLEELAQAGVNFNVKVGDEGERPIHLAVQGGHKEAVQWLMDHGADPHKNDSYQRNAFTWAESGPGFDCLPILQGKPERPEPTAPASDDAPGIAALTAAAGTLPEGVGLMIRVQIKTPPVTRIETMMYPECQYILSMEVGKNQVTFKDVQTPRQDYLFAGGWPDTLFVPILQWPELTPLWESLEVEELDWSQALKKRNYQGAPRPDLLEAARSALEQGFNLEEANNRGVRLRKL